ncbi:acyl-CoA thioesterase [Streptomyces sp. NBC_00335]|uniref:acyl-CoA thioesterase n=1 Tax=unclassified Streptomyces TaxID=2593676 RepID=UPI00224F13F5|nr:MULTISPECIES: acyl-CoA thioesterase [unclassified Streptomyces]MCX5409649.1 acyl-CoA thioesterase [Streptomyces sp. NBC_00086]
MPIARARDGTYTASDAVARIVLDELDHRLDHPRDHPLDHRLDHPREDRPPPRLPILATDHRRSPRTKDVNVENAPIPAQDPKPVAAPGLTLPSDPAEQAVREFRCERRTRLSDLDRFGRVHNLFLIQYIEDAQVEFGYAATPGADGLLDVGWAAVRRDTSFLRPLPMMAEPVSIITAVGRLGRSTITLRSRVESQGVVHARSVDQFLACDVQGRRRRIDDTEHSWYLKWSAPENADSTKRS